MCTESSALVTWIIAQCGAVGRGGAVGGAKISAASLIVQQSHSQTAEEVLVFCELFKLMMNCQCFTK